MTPQTIFEKIWDAHRIRKISPNVDLLLIDRVLIHERTGSVALRDMHERGLHILAPDHVFGVMDHIVDTFPGRTDKTLMPTGTAFIRAMREECESAGIRLYDLGSADQGICHVMSPELGVIQPGATLVCPDSHTCTQGAFGALAWGIGSTAVEHALTTSTLQVRRPRQMRIRIDGELAAGVTAKDLALALLAHFGSSGGAGYVVEYAGSAIEALDIEARMTLCNMMGTEFAAFTAIIAPDAKVLGFLKGRRFAPAGAEWQRAADEWRALASDDGAVFDAEHVFDGSKVAPMVSWGTNPQQAVPIDATVPVADDRNNPAGWERSLAYMGLAPGTPLLGLRIDGAFIGSCTNSRLGDLRRAAALLEGRHVAPGVRAVCVPGSTQVKHAAEAEGLDRIFEAGGFEWRESGCSMCFYAGGESFGPQERVISSTNRNFENRQGPGTRSHLASPETVVASAIAGCIADPRKVKMS